MSDALILERDGAVAIVTNNDPPRNRMTLEFIDALEELVPQLDADSSVRTVVITGAGDEHFSVGMNLKQFPEGVAAKGGVDELLDQRLDVLAAIENMSKPVVATLYGYCLGGGLELPLACHFRIAAEDGAQIGLPELDLGTVPAWGGTARLIRTVGRAHALDIMLRAKKISGPEAYRIGLATEVVPNAQLKARAVELAQELAAMPPVAVAAILKCAQAGEKPLAEGIAEERRGVHATMGTKDQQEGMMAFLEKRRPRFTGE